MDHFGPKNDGYFGYFGPENGILITLDWLEEFFKNFAE